MSNSFQCNHLSLRLSRGLIFLIKKEIDKMTKREHFLLALFFTALVYFSYCLTKVLNYLLEVIF